jgi:hypothetical protein
VVEKGRRARRRNKTESEPEETWESERKEEPVVEKSRRSRRKRKKAESEEESWGEEENNKERNREKRSGRRGREKRKAKTTTVDCPRCNREIELNIDKLPARLECPYCGATGTVG